MPLIGHGLMFRLRHRKHVQDCIEALQGYNEVKEQLELASEELRYAAKALGKITGAIDIEDILDAIFSEFCVGKWYGYIVIFLHPLRFQMSKGRSLFARVCGDL